MKSVAEAQASLASAQAYVKLVETKVWNARDVTQLQQANFELAGAYTGLEMARKDLEAAQKASQLMSSSAIATGFMGGFSTGLDGFYGTNANYGNAFFAANSAQNAGQAALFGLGSLSTLNNSLDAASNSMNSYPSSSNAAGNNQTYNYDNYSSPYNNSASDSSNYSSPYNNNAAQDSSNYSSPYNNNAAQDSSNYSSPYNNNAAQDSSNYSAPYNNSASAYNNYSDTAAQNYANNLVNNYYSSQNNSNNYSSSYAQQSNIYPNNTQTGGNVNPYASSSYPQSAQQIRGEVKRETTKSDLTLDDAIKLLKDFNSEHIDFKLTINSAVSSIEKIKRKNISSSKYQPIINSIPTILNSIKSSGYFEEMNANLKRFEIENHNEKGNQHKAGDRYLERGNEIRSKYNNYIAQLKSLQDKLESCCNHT